MNDQITRLLTVLQLESAQKNADAKAAVERQKLTLLAKTLVAGGPSRPPSMPLRSSDVERLAVRVRAFRASLPPDEAAVLDDWLDRAARPR